MTSDARSRFEQALDHEIDTLEAAVDKVTKRMQAPEGDWERGYAKGYARALEQLCDLVESKVGPNTSELVREQALKLRKEVGQDV